MRLLTPCLLLLLLGCAPQQDPPAAPGDDDDADDDDDDDAPLGPQLGWSFTQPLPGGLPGCPVTAELTLSNVGDALLRVSSVSIEGDRFSVAPVSAQDIAPGAEAVLMVTWLPVDLAPGAATLRIETNDADEPSVAIAVDGVPSDRRMELRFTEAPAALLDLLFVIDTSACSNLEQTALADLIPGFLAALDAEGVDWQTGVTTTDAADAGDLEGGGWLTPSDEDAAATLQDRIQLGGDGSGLEQGLDGAHAALLPARLGPQGDHEGFKRAGSQLALVFLSDEEDGSTGFSQVEDWLHAFSLAAEHPDRLRAYAFTGGPEGCDADLNQPLSGSAVPSARYPFVAEESGGAWVPICSPDQFGGLLDTVVADTDRPRRAFALPPGTEPIAGTLEVLLDGAPAPEAAWSWDATFGAVILDEGIPGGQELELRWWPVGVCE